MSRNTRTVWVALLRGINVGGSKIVKMAELRELLESIGLRDVSTRLQSGNVVFTANDSEEAAVRADLESAMRERFGFDVDCFLRTADEIADAVDANPFSDAEAPERKWLTVHFSQERLDKAAERFAAQDAGPEKLVPRGRELFVYYAEGVGRSKLPQRMRRLKLDFTARNWNTLLKLRAASAALLGQ